MHPTDRRNAIYYGLFLLLTLPVIVYSCIDSYFYIIYLGFLVLFSYKNSKWHHNIISGIILYVFAYTIFFTCKKTYNYTFGWDSHGLWICIILSVVPSLLAILHVLKWVKRVNDLAKFEKIYYPLIEKYPLIACKTHHTRSIMTRRFGYKKISCRTEYCFDPERLIHAVNIVGVIGKDIKSIHPADELYVELWNREQVQDADYDRIDIYESSKIKDYDAIINKVIAFFYNEINRYKPIKEIKVAIKGNPGLSKNTRRLLEEKFLTVEYS